jgi:putative transposase
MATSLPSTGLAPAAPPAGHGGRRANAGRKLAPGARRSVEHRRRPVHTKVYPSHVTVPFAKSVGSLRRERIFKMLRRVFLHPKVAGFQVVHYSVQSDHVHLVVEATSKKVLSSGMRSLVIRAALRMNLLLGRRGQGKVIRDRYHRRDLFTPRQVRNVLAYVLLNGAKHRRVGFGKLDAFSSSRSFDGWQRDARPCIEATSWIPSARGDPAPPAPWTLLLSYEWRVCGLLSPDEALRWAPPPPPANALPLGPSV